MNRQKDGQTEPKILRLVEVGVVKYLTLILIGIIIFEKHELIVHVIQSLSLIDCNSS